jgi:hypothetical protein
MKEDGIGGTCSMHEKDVHVAFSLKIWHHVLAMCLGMDHTAESLSISFPVLCVLLTKSCIKCAVSLL